MDLDRTFVSADLHLGDPKILSYKHDDGRQIRPFRNLEAMHEAIINNFNSVVEPGDKTYILGDEVIDKKYLHLIDELNGTKILIGGNHSCATAKESLKYFKDVRGVKVIPEHNLILTHYPIHPDSLRDRFRSVAGHTHTWAINDPRYINVGVDVTNFYPISLRTVIDTLDAQVDGTIRFGKVWVDPSQTKAKSTTYNFAQSTIWKPKS